MNSQPVLENVMSVNWRRPGDTTQRIFPLHFCDIGYNANTLKFTPFFTAR